MSSPEQLLNRYQDIRNSSSTTLQQINIYPTNYYEIYHQTNLDLQMGYQKLSLINQLPHRTYQKQNDKRNQES